MTRDDEARSNDREERRGRCYSILSRWLISQDIHRISALPGASSSPLLLPQTHTPLVPSPHAVPLLRRPYLRALEPSKNRVSAVLAMSIGFALMHRFKRSMYNIESEQWLVVHRSLLGGIESIGVNR